MAPAVSRLCSFSTRRPGSRRSNTWPDRPCRKPFNRGTLIRKYCLVSLAVIASLLVPGISSAVQPEHDNFGGAKQVPSSPYSDSSSNFEATLEPGEPDACGIGTDKTVWYSFTPAANATLVAKTFGSSFDTVLAIYEGSDLANLYALDCNNNYNSPQSAIVFNAYGGVTYTFQIGGYNGATGDLIFALGEPGAVAGTITVPASSEDMYICVSAYTAAGDSPANSTATLVPAGGSGDYFMKVPPGDHKINFIGCNGEVVHEWYNDQPHFLAANVVTVTDSAATGGIDAALELQGEIAGTVTVPGSTSDHLVCIEPWGVDGSFNSGLRRSVSVPAGGSAGYAIYLDPGDWKLFFYDCGDYVLASEWYDNKPDFDSADPVTVLSGESATGIDAALSGAGGSQPGGITGTVTVPGASSDQTVCVTAFDAFDQSFVTDTAVVASAGQAAAYYLQLDAGDYKVEFEDCSSGSIVTQWYRAKSDFYSADVVTLSSGEVRGGIDATMALNVTPPPPAVYDLAMTALSVEKLPIETDYGSVGSGWIRRIDLSASNLGNVSSDLAYLSVKACPQSTLFSCDLLHAESFYLEPGESLDRSIRWNALGWVGEVKIIASICTSYDFDHENNRREVDHYVVVGNVGTGAGVPRSLSSYDPC